MKLPFIQILLFSSLASITISSYRVRGMYDSRSAQILGAKLYRLAAIVFVLFDDVDQIQAMLGLLHLRQVMAHAETDHFKGGAAITHLEFQMVAADDGGEAQDLKVAAHEDRAR